MQVSPATFVNTHARRPLRNLELMLRYGAAYGCMLVALVAAQLVSSNAFVLSLMGVTLIGLPLSLAMRRMMAINEHWRSYRVVLNTVVVVGSIVCSALYLFLTHPELLTPQFMNVLMVHYGVADSIKVLMEVFLIFSTARAVAVINDKEAVLSAVPSFSALLLLMVIHRGPQVVIYFLVWTVLAAVLFALDHRAESSTIVHGRISAVKNGQEARLSARGLASVLGFSLVIALGIAYVLSSRNPQDRSQLEQWVMGMASGMTKLALSLPDVSINNGPERQIDYTSGPALPSRTELWRVAAITFNRQLIRPQYWRMFTLVNYDGKSWSQGSKDATMIARRELNEKQWPLLDRSDWYRNVPRNQEHRRWNVRKGYDVIGGMPDGEALLHRFGGGQRRVRVVIESRASNIGFIPMLPVVKTVRQRGKNLGPIRAQKDGSINMGVLQRGQHVQMLASVPANTSYGLSGHPPLLASERPNPQAQLSPEMRKKCLQLPDYLRKPSSPLLKLTHDILKNADPEDSAYSRGRRLAAAVEARGVYTLRPPALPEDADAAEYFLLQNSRGYCTYFAGGLTVLCRLAGIPARVVSGFVNPEWEQASGVGVLREANAHAWTEIWVPGWGWAPLDATPPGERGNNAMGVWGNWTDFAHNSYVASRNWLLAKPWTWALPMLLLFGVGLWTLKKRGLPMLLRRWLIPWLPINYRDNPTLASRTVIQSYHRMARRMSRRYRPRTNWETSQEWLEAAQLKMPLEHPEAFRELTALYERARYASHTLDDADVLRAITIIRSLSWKQKKPVLPEQRLRA